MGWFNDLKIGKKVGLGFGSVLTLTAILGALSLIQISKVNSNVEDIGSNWMVSITHLGQLRVDASMERRWEMNFRLATDRNGAQGKMDEARAAMAEDEKLYETTITSSEERQLYQGFRAAWEQHLAVRDKILGLVREGKDKEADALSTSEAVASFAAADKFLADDVQVSIKGGADAMKASDATYSESRLWVALTLLAAIVLGFAVATAIARSVAGAAALMLAVIQEVAANNLAIDDLQIDSDDEIGQAGVALNQMKNSLRDIVQRIMDTAYRVASASGELSASSQQISANSEETSAQASTVSQATQHVSHNLQSVSTGAGEMTTTIQSIASNAHEAATVAANAVQTAQGANAIVAKLGASSGEIGEVIKVITSIAQQTNLLALNATIEAARAGEAGKGFAVVANEVKELAKQTAKATEDISRKITAIQTDTQGAVESIGAISGVISQISDISATIATAVEQQSATTNEMTRNVADAAKGSGEITHNISGVAEAARGTSASAQESQKAANELAEMATQLQNLVGQFRTGGEGSAHQGTPRAKSRAAHAGA